MQITCPAHPEMFPAWQAPGPVGPGPHGRALRPAGVQGRGLPPGFWRHKPDYADVTQPLPPQARAAADDLNAYLSFRRCYPACETFWKVNYRYRGEQVAQLSQEAQGLIVRVNRVYRWEDQEGFNALLAEQDPAFQRFVLRHLPLHGLLHHPSGSVHPGAGLQEAGLRRGRYRHPGPQPHGRAARPDQALHRPAPGDDRTAQGRRAEKSLKAKRAAIGRRAFCWVYASRNPPGG